MHSLNNEDEKARSLEKANRILQKKLDRCEAERKQLETDIAGKEFLLKQVIRELEISQQALQQRSEELESALQNLHLMQAQSLREKMSALGQMVAGIAHEINNPVSFIHANLAYVEQYSEELLRQIQLYRRYFTQIPMEMEIEQEAIDLAFIEQDLKKLIDSMQVGTKRIREVVQSLRNFSRLGEAELKAVDIHEGIHSTLLILQHRLQGTADFPDIQVIQEYAQLPLVKCYPGQLNQVFMNILTNAIDALEEARQTAQSLREHSPQIAIRTTAIDAQWVQIVIADNGIGIPKEIQQRIFDPFFTTKPVGKGTGMGLSISYQIVTRKHGGKLECFSTLNKGTEFVIQIPVRQTDSATS